MKGAWKLIFATTVVCTLGLIGGKAAHGSETTVEGGVPGVVTGSRVNVRSGPTSSRTILSIATKDKKVRVFDYKDGWYKIDYPSNAVCWVSSRLLDAKAEGTKRYGVVRSGSINVRASGNLKAVVVGQANAGDKLEIVGQVSDWYKVKAPSYARAWIYGKYVKVDDGAIDSDYTRLEARYLQAKKDSAGTEVLMDIIEGFKELAAAEGTDAGVKAACETRTEDLMASLTPSQKMELQAREQQRLAAKIEAEKARIEALRAAQPKPNYLAEGTVHELVFAKKGGPAFRLKTGDITLYHLESKSVDLSSFIGKKVGIMGQVTTPHTAWGGQAQEVITVSDVHEIN